MGLDDVTKVAELLQSYGGWGLSAILMAVVVALFLRFDGHRNKLDAQREAERKETLERHDAEVKEREEHERETRDMLLQLTAKVIETCIQTKDAMDRVAGRIDSVKGDA